MDSSCLRDRRCFTASSASGERQFEHLRVHQKRERGISRKEAVQGRRKSGVCANRPHNYTLNMIPLLDKTTKKGNLGGVSPPHHLDAVVSFHLPFIVELSNIIINIEI